MWFLPYLPFLVVGIAAAAFLIKLVVSLRVVSKRPSWQEPGDEEPGDDELTRIANAFASLSQQPQSALIARYEARLHRMFQHALKNLLLLRTIELPNEIGWPGDGHPRG